MTLGRMIRVARVERGWRQGDLAERISAIAGATPQSTVSKWESDDRKPSLPQWDALVRVLGWTPEQEAEARAMVSGPEEAA